MPTNYYWQPQFFSPSGIPEVLLFSVISVVVLERVELISYRFLEVFTAGWCYGRISLKNSKKMHSTVRLVSPSQNIEN